MVQNGTDMKQFTLKIATSMEQSKRLLTMGITPETCDCAIERVTETEDWSEKNTLFQMIQPYMDKPAMIDFSTYYPSWSLSRLMEMMPTKIVKGNKVGSLFVSHEDISYFGFEEGGNLGFLIGYSVCDNENVFDIAIDMIEHLIKLGHFNKEYLK